MKGRRSCHVIFLSSYLINHSRQISANFHCFKRAMSRYCESYFLMCKSCFWNWRTSQNLKVNTKEVINYQPKINNPAGLRLRKIKTDYERLPWKQLSSNRGWRVKEFIPHIGLIQKVILVKLFLDHSWFGNPRRVFSRNS